MELDSHLMHTEGFDRLCKNDLFLVQLKTMLLLRLLRNLLRRNGTKDLAILSGLHGNLNLQALQLLCQRLGLCKAFRRKLVLVLLLKLKLILILLRRFYTDMLRKNKVSCLAIADIDNISLFAKGFHILQQNYLHDLSSCL